MAISTLCPGCQTLFRLPDDLAGKHVRCQKCSRLLTVPGVLAAIAKAPPKPPPLPSNPPTAAPPSAQVVTPPALPLESTRAEAKAPGDGVPGVVLVEVPVKPTPPALPAATETARPTTNGAPPRSAPTSAPTMTLSGRERPRRGTANRPRRPSSALAGLSLVAMLLLFVGLLGASGAAWIMTEWDSRPHRPPLVQKQFNNGGFQQGGPIIIQPPVQGGPFGDLGNPKPKNGAEGATEKFKPGPKGDKVNDQRAITITLQNGQATVRQALLQNDPADPVRRWGQGPALPCKVFLVQLEQGKRYVIDYQRALINPEFDPYLRIEDLAGNRLVEHDDVGNDAQAVNHDMNSRVEFHPAKTGTYRIVCTVYQRVFAFGQMDFTLKIHERPVAPAITPLAKMPTPRKEDEDPLDVSVATEKDLHASVLTRKGELRTHHDACWSADGKWAFVLDSRGTLLKLNSIDLTEEARLPLGRLAGGLAMSSQGLVVTIPPTELKLGGAVPVAQGTREVWLIDPDTLHLKKRFGAYQRTYTGGAVVASAPNLPFAFIASTGETSSYPGGYGVLVLDLRNKNKSVRFYDIPHAGLAVSPNGEHLFVMDSDNVLTSYAINAATGELEFKQTSHPYLRNGNAFYRIDCSADGKLVCVSGANMPLALQGQQPKWGPSNVPVYAVDDLRKPLFALATDQPQSAVGFGRPGGERLLSQASHAAVAVFDGSGKRRESYRLPAIGNKDDQPQKALQFLTHPDGTKVLIRFEERLCLANFNREAAPVVRNKPNLPQPTAVQKGESIAGEVKKQGDVTWRVLDLPNLGELDPCWSADGKTLFHIDNEGTLTRYRADTFTPTNRLALGRAAKAMAISAAGLVVALRDEPEVWVIDPQSLQIGHCIVCPEPMRYLACAPKQDRAVAVGAQVLLLDLKQGRVVATGLQPHEDANLPFRRPVLTPDGQYVLLAHPSAGAAKVVRVKQEPTRLVVAEAHSTGAAHAFCVTADGKQVAWYNVYGKGKQQPVEFFAIDNWKAPVATLPAAARAMAAADDGSIYVQTTEFELKHFARPGANVGVSLRWDEGRVGIRDLAAQPGRATAFLASTGSRVLYGERTAK